jgi:glycosyltransferase involved in cell wall biosynthesis
VTPTLLELVPLERGLIAFSAGGRFLCAEPNGGLDLSKPWCSTWECFLASEDWCGVARDHVEEQRAVTNTAIDWLNIRKFLIDARLRTKVNSISKAPKILIYGYPYWSHGRVYHDICKFLYKRGCIVDIINWQIDHADYIDELKSFYDLFISALDGIRTLVDSYGVPYEQIIALSHHEMDIRILIDQKGVDVFEKFAGYGVVGYQLFDASAIFGIAREPMVAQLGVDFSEFFAEIPERLRTVGYASSFSHKTIHGIEIKRGVLAEAAARETGLEFKLAGSTANQTSIHNMPDFYRSVDAVLVSSVTEGAQLPVREAAAAGRLVISTPVGDFPLRASQGVGIVAPIESVKYKKFAAETLKFYRDNPAAFTDMCRKTQESGRKLDWSNMIDDWSELIESAMLRGKSGARAKVA